VAGERRITALIQRSAAKSPHFPRAKRFLGSASVPKWLLMTRRELGEPIDDHEDALVRHRRNIDEIEMILSANDVTFDT
jgi:hypothetical protein